MTRSDDEKILDWASAYGFESAHAYASDGTRLRWVFGGPKDARRLVLLHGAPQFSYMWRKTLGPLAERYRVVVPDLRGYGASDLAESGRYDLDVLVGDLEVVVAATARRDAGEEPILLAAHDWGGPIAWTYAARRPSSVRHLVAVNAPHPAAFVRELARPRQAIRSWYIAAFQLPGAPRLVELRRGEPLVRMLTASSHGVFTDADLDVYRAALRRPGRAAAVLAYYRQAFAYGPPGRHENRIERIRGELRRTLASPRLEVPATIVWGGADVALSPSHPDAVRQYAARLEVRRLPGVGHWVPEACPEEVVRAILEGDASA